MAAGRTVGNPEGRRFNVPESPPLPTGFSPEALFTVASVTNEFKKLAVRYHARRNTKWRDGCFVFTIFIIPTERRPIERLAGPDFATIGAYEAGIGANLIQLRASVMSGWVD